MVAPTAITLTQDCIHNLRDPLQVLKRESFMTPFLGPRSVVMKAITATVRWSSYSSTRCLFSAPVKTCVRVSFRASGTIERKFLSGSSHRGHDSLSFKQYTLPSRPSNAEKSRSLKMKRTAYIALGSNLGDRIGWIEKACNEMDARGIRVKRTSSLWETEPMYVLDQDRFVNGACEVSLPRERTQTPRLNFSRLRRSWSRWLCWINFKI